MKWMHAQKRKNIHEVIGSRQKGKIYMKLCTCQLCDTKGKRSGGFLHGTMHIRGGYLTGHARDGSKMGPGEASPKVTNNAYIYIALGAV